jgi:hypothetical protein
VQPYPTRYLTGLGFFEPVTEIFYLVGRLFFLYYNKSKKQSRLILLLEFFCLSFIGFANCGTNLVLLSGDAFSVIAKRIFLMIYASRRAGRHEVAPTASAVMSRKAFVKIRVDSWLKHCHADIPYDLRLTACGPT